MSEVNANPLSVNRSIMRKRRINERNLEIYDAVIAGRETYTQIGARFGLTGARISQIADAIDARMAKELAASVETLKSRQTGQIRRLVREALAAWHRSQQDAEQTKTKGKAANDVGDEVVPSEVERIVKGQAGDPRFLQLVRDLLSDERAIWGLDAPKKSEVEKRIMFRNPRERLKAANERMARLLGETLN